MYSNVHTSSYSAQHRLPLLSCACRFVTRSDLTRLGLDHLLGTALLRAYMHGFFIDARLYSKASSAVQPFAYEQYRAQRVAAKLEEERQSRISVVKKLPKVCWRWCGNTSRALESSRV